MFAVTVFAVAVAVYLAPIALADSQTQPPKQRTVSSERTYETVSASDLAVSASNGVKEFRTMFTGVYAGGKSGE